MPLGLGVMGDFGFIIRAKDEKELHQMMDVIWETPSDKIEATSVSNQNGVHAQNGVLLEEKEVDEKESFVEIVPEQVKVVKPLNEAAHQNTSVKPTLNLK